MRRYRALGKEAFDIVQQTFQPPQEPAALRAFYDYSTIDPLEMHQLTKAVEADTCKPRPR
ncbi:uncharacterized protein EI90DRAFT_3101752 [Cantharellus anzutake]|uniref:uncharacterized protein n=1 Tax=Cantharellus anzutake TaxID=1750568 RepID=UPI0019078E46|nr:uncharacterized protein EI90DRAFT_3107329 [Cantharellus anzutake]XP_038907610.1 uncharacterized protein EI90DRAFT_3101752 [Cantharellus anzutake]KAF8308854.1 hypothetical protein EI90DRAFT_3107329 [Cantharellus anzutake]KAF8310345.1 hypothetical protein EI90DRAFT_3101752 [Cantharellus anzutake]